MLEFLPEFENEQREGTKDLLLGTLMLCKFRRSRRLQTHRRDLRTMFRLPFRMSFKVTSDLPA